MILLVAQAVLLVPRSSLPGSVHVSEEKVQVRQSHQRQATVTLSRDWQDAVGLAAQALVERQCLLVFVFGAKSHREKWSECGQSSEKAQSGSHSRPNDLAVS